MHPYRVRVIWFDEFYPGPLGRAMDLHPFRVPGNPNRVRRLKACKSIARGATSAQRAKWPLAGDVERQNEE